MLKQTVKKTILSVVSIILLLSAYLSPAYAIVAPLNTVDVSCPGEDIGFYYFSTFWSYSVNSSTQVIVSADLNLKAYFNSSNSYDTEINIYLDDVLWKSYDGRMGRDSIRSFSFDDKKVKSISIEARANYTGIKRLELYNSSIDIGVPIAGEITETYALEAKNAANSAKSSADAAKSSADSAKTEATAAKNIANTASSRVWDTTEGKSAATLSKEARDKANAAAGDTTYIRNTQLPELRYKIDNLETTENNINNNVSIDNVAPSIDWCTLSGAYFTSGSSPTSLSSPMITLAMIVHWNTAFHQDNDKKNLHRDKR